MNNHAALYEFDCGQACAGGLLAGVDEAGRGPLAGPVVAAAVCLDLTRPIEGINDSKKLSPEQREALYGCITAQAQAWAVGEASVSEIDTINILQASLLAMRRAVAALTVAPAHILVDGLFVVPGLTAAAQTPLVKGDGRSASVAAASIVAKVTRDRIMHGLALQFPQYEFDAHKGYGTARHRQRITEFGLSTVHRRSFCKKFLHQGENHGTD
jgi:ribonuclease HII